MNGIVAYGAHVPFARLDRKLIAQALGGAAGKGTRAVAGYDEDTTSMGEEAARIALRSVPGLAPSGVYFATAAPAYHDKTNATAIHAALALPVPFVRPLKTAHLRRWLLAPRCGVLGVRLTRRLVAALHLGRFERPVGRGVGTAA